MKKTIAVILSVIMAVCLLPMASAASTQKYEVSASYATSNDLQSGVSYIIPAGVTMTVPVGVNLYIPSASSLTVEEGGKLVVNGTVNVQKGAQLFVAGTIINSDNVSGEGSAIAELRFAEHDSFCTCGKGDECTDIAISLGTEDFTGTKVVYSPIISGEVKTAALNSVVYVKVEITEPVAKYNMYDEKYVDVYFSGVTVKGEAGVHQTKVSTAADVTFTKFDGSRYFYTDCNVTLPKGPGYSTEGFFSDAPAYVYQADGTPLTVKFGSELNFKVDIDEDYDLSPYEVYIYNGVGFVNGKVELDGEPVTDANGFLLYVSGVDAAKPDENGYYTFTVRGNSTISVIGLIENERIEFAGDLLSIITNIFNMFRSFFAQFLALFGIKLG